MSFTWSDRVRCDILDLLPMDTLLVEFGITLVLATVLGTIARMIKLPPILGYIFVGLILSLFAIDQSTEVILRFFSHLGVAFLLFMLGLELNVREIHEVGPVALTTGIGQVVVTSIIGFGAAMIFGFGVIESLYIAVALTFSSTIIIVKLLGEKGDLNALYGRISVGLLIVQDLVAVIALIVLNFIGSASTGVGSVVSSVFTVVVIGVLLVAMAFVLGRILGVYLQRAGKSSELVLVTVMAWAIIFSMYTQYLGLSLEVGAFLAGISLSSSRVSLEIAAKMKPLRDFFIIMFFIVLGLGLSLSNLAQQLPMIIIFSLMVLLGNPLILLSIMGVMGYHRRVSFLTGLTVSQISEFSLILIATGVSLGQVQSETLSIVTGVAIVTLVGSSYLISQGEFVYRLISRPLQVFQRKKMRADFSKNIENAEHPVIVFGAHRTGEGIVEILHKQKVPLIVIDYDPAIIKNLLKRNITALYGDISDAELLAELDVSKVKVIISTVPNFEDNGILLGELDAMVSLSRRPRIIMRANDLEQAQILKKRGADAVLVPETVAGEKIIEVLIHYGIVETISKKGTVQRRGAKTRNNS